MKLKYSIKQLIVLFDTPFCLKVRKKIFHQKITPHPEINPLPMRDRKGNRMIVIGNGPSLNKSIELYGDIVKNTECMMVNFSASTNMFEEIKPSVYVLADPAWFYSHDCSANSIIICLDDIVNKTKWPMTLVIPSAEKDSEFLCKIKKNKNITVNYFYSENDKIENMSLFDAWDRNLVIPPMQTVLNTCVWLSLYWGYPETYLIGADTSFHENLKMNQTTNELYTIDKHFYDNKVVCSADKSFDDKNQRVINTKLHEELYSIYVAMKNYWDLRGYADWKGCAVYNASEYSWIDAFERKKLSD